MKYSINILKQMKVSIKGAMQGHGNIVIRLKYKTFCKERLLQ